MDNYQTEAARIAIEEASKDPDLHSYTEPARNGQPFVPHRWVVNALVRVLKQRNINLGQAATDVIGEIVDKRMERMDRRITTVVDSVTERLRALEGTGDRTSSPARTSVVDVLNLVRDALVRVTALEDAPRRLNELDARCDALASRIEQLESGRTGPRDPVAWVGDMPQRLAKHGDTRGGVTFTGEGNTLSPFPPGVADPTTEALRNAADLAQRLKTEQYEHRQTIDQKNQIDRELQAARKQRDEDTETMVALRRLVLMPYKGHEIVDAINCSLALLTQQRDAATDDAKAAREARDRMQERLRDATVLIDSLGAAIGLGKSLADPLGSRAQIVEKVKAWIEDSNKAIEVSTTKVAELQAKRLGQQRTITDQQRTITDQAAQITELRTESTARKTLVEQLSREATEARTDADRQRTAVANITADRDRIMSELTEANTRAKQHYDRLRQVEEAKQRVEKLHADAHEKLADGAKLQAELTEARENAAMFDVDRCNLRMDLDVAQATIKRMQPFVDAGQKAVGILHYDARPHPTLVAFMEAGETYEQACAKAADATIGEPEPEGCGTEGCTDPDCPA